MKVTFILKGLTDAAHATLAAMPDAERFAKLDKWARGDLAHCVKEKIGDGSFRDRVDLNAMMRAPVTWAYTLEPRRGYRLATFDVCRA